MSQLRLRHYVINRLPVGGQPMGSYVVHAHRMDISDGEARFYVVDHEHDYGRVVAVVLLANVEAVIEEESGRLTGRT